MAMWEAVTSSSFCGLLIFSKDFRLQREEFNTFAMFPIANDTIEAEHRIPFLRVSNLINEMKGVKCVMKEGTN